MGIDFPILSDPGKAVARAYGVLGSSGFPSRWTFYIGIDGRIQQIDKQVRTGMHGLDIEKTLNDLQTARRRNAGVCRRGCGFRPHKLAARPGWSDV